MSLESISTSWHSYPKIYSVGHSYLSDFFSDEVLVEEKIDGSQFSFGIFNGEIKIRSKGVQMFCEAPEKMFSVAVETVKSLSHLLKDGWTYRAEYLRIPKHNAVSYDRIPKSHLIIFDINTGHETYLDYDSKKEEALRIGLEVVPVLHKGMLTSASEFMNLLNIVSVLGGQKIEGIVCKNYFKIGPDKKVLMAKFVSEEFKELNKSNWRSVNPKAGDIIQVMVGRYKADTRWLKAIQHLRESGLFTQSPKDIPNLIKEFQKDLETECELGIKQDLYDWAFPQISRQCIKGFPEFFKEWLVKEQFKEKEEENKKEKINDHTTT